MGSALLDTFYDASDTQLARMSPHWSEINVKRELFVLAIAAIGLAGCQSDTDIPPSAVLAPASQPAAQDSADSAVAIIRGEKITLAELQTPLIQAYGMNFLLELVQLDLAKQEAERQSIIVSPQDVDNETNITLIEFRRAAYEAEAAQGGGNPSSLLGPSTEPSDQTLSPEDRDKLENLLLTSQHLTKPEFDIVMERNAYLRKLVAPEAEAQLTDANLHERFNAVYGEKARVQYIRLPDMMSVAQVESELKSGQSFADEMRVHAYDTVGQAAAGSPPPFTRKDQEYPPGFREAVFDLKPGQVSDPIQVKNAIYLVQLVELIPPRFAKFEDCKDWLKQDLYEREVQSRIKQYLESLKQVALDTLEIENPELKKQWDQNLHSAEELRQQLKEQQAESMTTQPAETAPTN